MEDITKAPLAVLEVLRPFMDVKTDIIERVQIEKGYLKFQGTGICKNFYFAFNNHEVKNQDLNIYVEICPYNNYTPSANNQWVSVKNLSIVFQQWIDALKKYDDHGKAFGDNLREKKIIDQILSEFGPLEENNEEHIPVNELIKVDEALENLKLWIKQEKQNFLPVLYEDIQQDIIALQQNLTESTKSELASRISKVFAKIMKNGPRFLKETTVEILKATVAEVVKTKLLGM